MTTDVAINTEGRCIALVWRGAPGDRPAETRNYERLRPVVDAFAQRGIRTEPVLYCEQERDVVRARLQQFDGVLVWVDPVSAGEDRTRLDEVLREAAAGGVWVSAHPDTIDRIGTKEVLYRTRHLGWGSDTALYTTADEFRRAFPEKLERARVLVVKENRSNGGLGVWKVAYADGDALVRVQHAAPRDEHADVMDVDEFMRQRDGYFAAGGMLVDQPFVPRIVEGMIRAYLVAGEVVGFARQQPDLAAGQTRANVLGLPSAKTMFAAGTAEFDALRTRLETEWVPELCEVVGLRPADLPMLWDADFLLGPKTSCGDDTYVLCEINASSVLPFPDGAPPALAYAVERRLRST